MGLLDQFSTEPIADPVAPPESQGQTARSGPILERFITQEHTPESDLNQFGKGLSTGTDQLQMSLFSVARLAGRELGIKPLEDYGNIGIDRNALEMQEHLPDVQGFSEIESMDDFFSWTASSLGQAIPSLATAVGGGGVGGVLAKKAVENSIRRTVANRMTRNLTARGYSVEQAQDAVQRALTSPAGAKMLKDGLTRGVNNTTLATQGFTRGAQLGAFGASSIPQTGEIDLSLQEAGVDSGLTALLGGAVGGALEALPALRLLDKMFPGVDRAVSQSFVKDFAISAGIQAGLEGSTEAAQEIIQLAALAYHDPSFDLLDPANATQVLDAFAAGALVGGVTGGAADITGIATSEGQKFTKNVNFERKTTLPEYEFEEADLDVADNTFAQELGSRINKVVRPVVEPAMNTVRTAFQSTIDRLDTDFGPGLNGEVRKLSTIIGEAHNQFVDEHKQYIDGIKRYVKEKQAFIQERAETLTGQEREVFIQEQMDQIKDRVTRVAEALKQRGERVAQRASSFVDGQQTQDQFADLFVNQTEIDTRFVFGKNNTEGDQVQGYATRKQARDRIEKLRQQFPSAPESAFQIRETETGFVVAIEDSGQGQTLTEDKIVTDALEAARQSARRNPNKDRQASIQRPGVQGRTNLDIPTLVFAGRRLDEGDNQTVEQAFAAITGRMLERGILSNDDFVGLQEAFNREFPSQERKFTLAEAERIRRTPEFKKRRERDLNRTATDPREFDEFIGDEQAFIEEGDGRNLETEEQQARRQSSASTARPKNRKPKPRKPRKTNGKKPENRKVDRKVNTDEKVAVWLPGLKDKTVAKAVKDLTDRVANLLSDKTTVRVINKEGAQRMIDQGHPHAEYAQAVMDHGSDFVHLRTPDGLTYILVDDFADPGRSLNGLVHELGHSLHYDTWASLNKNQQDALWNAFVKDVKDGKRATGRTIFERGDKGKVELAQVNIFEFREWMADQFVDWMNDRKQPQTALEKFLDAVADKMESFWSFLRVNPGRYGLLNETYAEFVDAVALKLRKRDPSGNNRFYLNENAAGRPTHVLLDGQGQIPPAGLAESQWIELRDRLETQYPAIAKRAALISKWMHNAYHMALAPSTSVMRSIGDRVPAAKQLVTIFNRQEQGKAKEGSNYHQRIKLAKGRFLNRFENITKGLTDAQKADLLSRLRALDGTDGSPTSLRERQVRKLFDDMHDYMRENGLPVGKIKNYFPRTFSREKLIADQDKILAQLKKHMTEDEARAFYNSMISPEADQMSVLEEVQKFFEKDERAFTDLLKQESPALRNMNSRTARGKFFDQYLDDNLDGIMSNYIVAATKRAEFNRVLGEQAPAAVIGGDRVAKRVWNRRGKFEQILKQAKQEGATDEDLRKMKNYVDANLGMYGRDDISDRTRTALATVVAYQNMRVLLFTVFASLPDVVGPAIRSGDMKGAFQTVVKNMREIVKNDSDLAEMSRAWGVVSSSANQHVLTEYVDNNFMPRRARKWNEKFFQYTGLNYYTDFTRKMALSVGIDTIKNQAAKLKDRSLTQKERDRAKQFLAELGLTGDMVDSWVANGEPVFGSVDYNNQSAVDERVAEALIQFVDESIMSPNPSQRPILASHPGAMLVYHLKGYIYAMHDIILKRLAHNFNIADTPAQVVAAIAPAILMLALTAFGLELRELITQDDRTDRMDGWDYSFEVLERSGLTGIAQLGFDFEGADARGQAELAALSGPAIGQLADLISKPASQTVPKAIPIMSQLPWARDALREGTPL